MATISTSLTGPIVLSGTNNPLTITSTGIVTSTASAADAIDGGSGGTWVLVNSGTISSSSGFGVSFGSQGTITNNGLIVGGHNAIRFTGSIGTVTNFGSIIGTAGDVIGMFAGGVLTNAAGATIASQATAGASVYLTGAAGTVTNSGTITGIDYAVDLGKGGIVTNNASGYISGHRGVLIQGAAGVVSNSGTINGTTSFGVRLAAGGQVTNAAGGSISGPTGVQIYAAAGTITNNGTITGTSHAIQLTGTGANRVAVGASAVFVGDIVGSTAAGSTNTMELAGGTGTLSAFTAAGAGTMTENGHSWSVKNFATVAVDAGAAWVLSGNNTIAAILDNGTIDLTGSLVVTGAIDSASTGVFRLDGKSLEVAAAAGANTQISFLGASQLVIDSAASFGTGVGTGSYAGPLLENFSVDDKIDLKAFSVTGVAFNYNAATGLLQVSNGAAQAASLAFDPASLVSGSFQAVTDGGTGTFIQLSATSTVTAALASDTGASPIDALTSNPALIGTGAANAVVTLTEGAVTLGTATANAAGAWTFSPSGLAQGAHTIVASEPIGFSSISFTLDSLAPAVTAGLANDTGIAGDNITADPTLAGTGDPNAIVTLKEGANTLGTATADATGKWTFAPSGMSQGPHTIVASETDAAGNTGSSSLSFTLQSGTTNALPAYSHIVVVTEENHDYSQIIGNPLAPYINTLAAGGALLDNFTGLTHPSQGNYFALYAGSTFGVATDDPVTESGPTLATILQGAGMSFTGWVEHPGTSIDHNPWESFPEGTSVEQDFATFPAGNFANLPTVSFVAPSIYNDMHDGTISQGDAWLLANLDSYAQWALANNSLLVVTFDEGDTSPINQVATVLFGAHVVAGDYNTAYNNYNLLSTILGGYNLAAPNNAAGAQAISVFDTGPLGSTGPGPSDPGGGNGETIGISVAGPVVVSTIDNPLSITASGVITATGAGIDAVDSALGATTINNDGTITSAGGFGVALAGSGTVNNGPQAGAKASISGGTAAVRIAGANGKVTNWGQISGGAGIILANGGTVTNKAGAFVSATGSAISIYGNTATVTNSGSIGSTAGVGVSLGAGGSVINNPGGSISGTVGVQVASAAGTVTNSGLISGTLHAIQLTGTGANRVVVGASAAFAGDIVGSTAGGSSNTLELAGGTGTLSGLTAGGAGTMTENGATWSINNFTTIVVDAGSAWTLGSGNTVATILDNGTIDLTGSLAVTGAIDPTSTGVFQLDGQSLEVAAAAGAGTQISFLGAAQIVIDTVTSFGSNVGTASYTGPLLENFGADDRIDLKAFGPTGVTFNYNQVTGLLQVANGAAQVASLAFQTSSLGAGSFRAVTDGGTGTFIQLGSAPAVTETLASDTGASAIDNITANPALTGTAELNALVTFTEEGNTLGTATANGSGVWTYAPVGLSQGPHTIVASAKDASGTLASASLTFTYDTLAPAVSEALVSDTGSSAADKTTANAGLTGTGDANAVVTLKEGASTLGTATANAAGVWTFTPASLAQGPHTIVASETDAAGNTGSATLTFSYDSAAPAVTETLVSDTGSSSSDKITSNGSLTGSGDANAVVTLKEGANTLGTATANGAGVWTFTPVSLAQGPHTIVASETDAAGNTGSASLTFTYDTVAPVVTEALVSDTGSSAVDLITANAALTGTGDANAVVTLKEGASTLGTATANAAGVWTFTPASLAQGPHTIVASETDAAGNTGSATLTFSYDSAAPAVTATLVSDTGSSPSDKITSNGSLTGTGDANAAVTLKEGANTLGTATANAAGVWTFTPVSLAQGPHTIVASETDAAGNTGSASLTFTYDTVAPTVTEALANDTGTPGDKITADPTLTGAGDTNAVVTLKEGATTLGVATANGSGTWTFLPTGLSQGAHTVVASETDAAGNTGSASLTFTLSGTVSGGGTISTSVTGPITMTGTLNPLTVASTGTVTSTGSGVNGINGATGTVWNITNNGTISSPGGIGVSLAGAGIISSSGLVSGVSGFVLRGGGTASNTGSIGGSGKIGSGNGNGSGIFMTGGLGTVTNGGIITGGAYGVGLDAGGQVTNTSTIIGGEDGVRIYGGAGALNNSGTIVSTVDDGIGFFGGGTVTNNAGGVIGNQGTKGAGIYITGGTTLAVTNSGQITGIDYAVFLAKGGSVTNNAGGYISSHRGVHIQGGVGVVNNSGTIAGAANFGIRLAAGGQVTNAAGGIISGAVGLGIYSAVGTVTNNGTISGKTHAITFSGSGANRLAVGATSAIIGDVVGSTASGATNTLELVDGSGTLSSLTGGAGSATENARTWAFKNFNTIAVDAAASWTLNGKNTVATLVNNGSLTIAGNGTLTVTSALDPASSGLLQIGAGATLEVAAALGLSTSIGFLTADRLVIDNAASFGVNVGSASYAGPLLQGFVAGDTIDIKQFATTSLASSFDAASGILQISNAAAKASLAFQTSSLGAGSFHIVSDGSTGIFVTHS